MKSETFWKINRFLVLSGMIVCTFSACNSTSTQAVKQATSTALASSANPSTYGSPVIFTATVTPASAKGTVVFYDSGTQIGSATLSGGKAGFSDTLMTSGTHSITAYYSGNGNDNPSTSPVLTQTVYPLHTFFVAPNGNDTWSGTLPAPNANNTDGPLASPAEAQIRVQAINPKNSAITILLRGGTYYLPLSPTKTGTLIFNEIANNNADNGNPNALVTWTNYPGEIPILSGGVPVNPDTSTWPSAQAGVGSKWKSNVNGISNWYQVTLPSTLQPFESLYYNGERRLRARVHDDGSLSAGGYRGIGYYVNANGECAATPAVPEGSYSQPTPSAASCALGTYLRVANTISPFDALGGGCTAANLTTSSNCCPYMTDGPISVTNPATSANTKCLDRFLYAPTSYVSGDAGSGDAITAWANLHDSYSGNPAAPCTAISGNTYPAGDVELTLFDAWTVDVMRVGCVDTADNAIFLTGATGDSNNPSNWNFFGPTVGHRYIIENTLDAFNDAAMPGGTQQGATGIWFLDRHTSPWTLNYLANSNETPESASIVIPQLGGSIPGAPALDFVGGSLLWATGLQYVNFSGITFAEDNYYPSATGFNNGGNGELSLPQAVDCESCQNVTFSGITVEHASSSGILIASTPDGTAAPAKTDSIANSTFYDVGSSGIRIGHTPMNSTDTASSVVNNITVSNNLVQGYSRIYPSGEGITEGNGNSNLFQNNTVMDGYHAAISICRDGCGPGNKVPVSGSNITTQYNLIHDTMQGITSDGGTLYYNVGNATGSGTGNKVLSNVLYNTTDSSIIDNSTTAGTTVLGSAYGGHGIYLDANSADVDVENNVVYNVSGRGLHITQGLVSSSETAHTFINNIIAFPLQAAFEQGQPWQTTGCPSSPVLQANITSNLFVFDRDASSTPEFYAVEGCSDTCGFPYTEYQNFQGNAYYRTDGGFATDSHAFRVSTTQGLNADNSCKAGPYTFLHFSSATLPNWQTGGTGVPVAMNEDLTPPGTASYNPAFPAGSTAIGETGNGLTGSWTDLPRIYSFSNNLSGNALTGPSTGFLIGKTDDAIQKAGSSLPPLPAAPQTFPIYVFTQY